MNHDITIRQWRNFSHHNHLHRANAPRTAREAFGCEFEGEDRRDAWVLIVAVAGLLIGMVAVWL